jgi:two-component system nitrogen regulation sensor histidine kinase NtrY
MLINKILAFFKFDKHLTRKFTLFLVVLAIISAITTYITITNVSGPLGTNSTLVTVLGLFDLILFLSLTTIIIRKILSLRFKRNGEHGNRLQNRVLIMFSFVATIPTIIVAVFSTLFFHYGIESWFDKTVSTALDGSVMVAESYLKEHREVLKVRSKAMAMEIDNNIIHYNLLDNMPLFVEILSSLAELNSVSEAVIFQNNKPLVRTRFGLSLSFENISQNAYEKAALGDTVIIKSDPDRVRAIIALRNIPNGYLVIGKLIDNNVVKYMHQSQGAAKQYRNLKNTIVNSQIEFSIIFFIVSLLLLLAAIWLGITFAGYIVKPIKKLVYATERIKSGDFNIRVDEGKSDDEIAILTRAFNLMTEQIDSQRNKLIDAYHEIDSKREFSEAVLSGVSAGVIALSPSKKITLINSSALSLLNINDSSIIGKSILKILPESTFLLDKAQDLSNDKYIAGQVQVKAAGKKLILLIRVAVEFEKNKIKGFIITFDDMTELVKAQRNAAWSDVARRIAHEVKNPLTPINLGAERLLKKYKNEVKDQITFEKYTNTIIRHANDIGKIIEEFSNFARMPAQVAVNLNMCQLIKDIVFSRHYISTEIKYEFISDYDEIIIKCDQTQFHQVFTNIFKNAQESIESTKRAKDGSGLVRIYVNKNDEDIIIEVIDNGRGFDQDNLDRITEPYFTTRSKGTGLGLAIVKKIVDDHQGKMVLSNDDDGCAHVKITLPLNR